MNFYKKKNLGQNFLNDKKIINKIVQIGNINRENNVIEVGPGNGALTKKIIEKEPKSFVVIEKDHRLVSILNDQFGNSIRIINEDMLRVSYENYLKKNVIIFGNLPYNISTQILVKWIKLKDLDKYCKKLILMFQKEVAERILAESNTKNYGRLSILSKWRMNIEKVIDIEPESFSPAPRVKSSLLVFIPKTKYYKINDPKNLEHITNVFFSNKRKMIKKPLKFLFNNFEEISEKLTINLNLRPQNLSTLTYYKICELYEKSVN